VLENDRDPDGDALAIHSVTSPAHGTVTMTATQVTYTPDLDYFGADAFTYTIADPDGLTATASVRLTIQNSNDAPTAAWDLACVPKNGAGRTLDLLANDTDSDTDDLEIIIPTGAAAWHADTDHRERQGEKSHLHPGRRVFRLR